jgi:hypothetical protein
MKKNKFGTVREIMMEFADLTGLVSTSGSPRRYLWTDAFAVCNFLELYHQTNDDLYKHLALRLVDQVHEVLGRHRDDDTRTGWISGLDREEGKIHPTSGGLRIGKKLNERKPFEPLNERLEWDRDGQYFHYLTKWMHALNCASRTTEDPRYNIWAIELAKTAQARFAYVPASGGPKLMHWKMSIDLSYPLVASMGHHDPLDGLVTYIQLQTSQSGIPEGSLQSDLSSEIADMVSMCREKNWATDDPLGIGELLCNACKLIQLTIRGAIESAELLASVLDSSLLGLESYARESPFELPADYRLAFRELGLSIGLRAVEKMQELIEQNPGLFSDNHLLHSRTGTLARYKPLRDAIEAFWLEPENRATLDWTAHREINMVMLATSMAPQSYLTL